MGESHSGIGDGTELTLLFRDPEEGYLFWECPALEGAGAQGELSLSARGHDGEWEELHREVVREATGGRFIGLRPGQPHRARLQWPHGSVESRVVEAPRRSPGDQEPRFVRVRLGEQGLMREPCQHRHPSRGLFKAATTRSGSSTTGRR